MIKMTFEQLQAALTQAMKEKNRVKKTVIADMVACAKNMAIEKGCKDNITEEITDAAILKSKKICQEQIDTCPASRPELAAEYAVKMAIIDQFAPTLMESEAEIKNYVIELGIELTKANRGKIMSVLKGKADMKIANQVVGKMLQ